jgi:hypothetical protein
MIRVDALDHAASTGALGAALLPGASRLMP